jgi:hypothetical protein
LPGAQFGTALLNDDGSADVPTALSSLNRNPAIRFSLPLSAGTERQREHTTRDHEESKNFERFAASCDCTRIVPPRV